MFKNDFQGTPFFEIFSSNGPLAQNWKFVNRTFIGKTYDKQVKGYCYSCDKIGRLSIPKDKVSIYLIQPFLNLQIYIPQGANISLELLMSDLSGDRRRFFLSTAQLETKINALHVNLPIPGLIRGKWVNVVFDLASLMNENFRNQTFRSLNGLTLSGTFKLRKIFTLKFRPPDTSGAEIQDYDYANRHIEAIPRAVSFPIGVENLVQIYNMNRILIPVSASNKSFNAGIKLPKLKMIKKSTIDHSSHSKTSISLHNSAADSKSIVNYETVHQSNARILTSCQEQSNPKKMIKLPAISHTPISKKIYDSGSIAKQDRPNSVVELESPCYPSVKTYDPSVYSRQESPDISASDQLQNEIELFFKNCQSEHYNKHKVTSENDLSKIPTKVSPDQDQSVFSDADRFVSAPKALSHVSSIVGQAIDHSNSDEELQNVANSLNSLLSDLKHDSETTLYPMTEMEPKYDKYSFPVNSRLDSTYVSSDEEGDGKLELIFDMAGTSFTDPRTGKCYRLDD